MKWKGITIEVPSTESEDAVVQLLLNAGCAGVAFAAEGLTKSVSSYIPNDENAPHRLRQIDAALAMLPLIGISGVGAAAISTVDEEDWANSWKAYFKPIRVGRRIVITPPWESPSLRVRDILLTIDPGMAFGTGTHATTQLCLIALEEYLQPTLHVADIGTGSGILAIAAMKLGAASVIAVDNDPLAVRIASENATVNLVPIETSVFFPTCKRFGLVVSNIIAETLIDMAEDLAAITEGDGILIVSGVIEGREDDVRIFIEGAGFTALETRQQGEWVALVFRRTTA
jgi:ribosomal protein L11 methyltransferase